MGKDQQKGGAQSVVRAIAVLKKVTAHNDSGIRLSQLARDLDLALPTAHRLLAVLDAEGLIYLDQSSKKYHLGFEAARIGMEARQYLVRDRFRPALKKIADLTEDTVFLSIGIGYDILCVDRVEGRYPIRAVTVDIGDRRPMGIGVGSLSLAAFASPEYLEEVLTRNGPRYPKYNGVTSEDLRNMAQDALVKGYVVGRGIYWPNVTSLGMAVFDQDEKILAAITVSAINERLPAERMDEIHKTVRQIIEAEGLKLSRGEAT